MLTWTGSDDDCFARTNLAEYRVHWVDPVVDPWGEPEPRQYIARFRNPGATDFQILETWPLDDQTPEELEEKRHLAKQACEAHFTARASQ